MKEKFKKYLKSIGMTQAILDRIETIYTFYEKICPEEIIDIFVTYYLKKDGTKEYGSLWLFSERYLMEAKYFLNEDDFDITPIKNRINYCGVKRKDYDFENAEENSRLNIDIRLDTDIVGEFIASEKNCDYLKDIVFKYIVPNIKK